MSTVAQSAPTTVVSAEAGGLSWGEALRLSRLGGREESLRRGLVVLCAALATVPVYFGAGLPAAARTDGPTSGYALSFIHDRNLWPGILLALALMTLPAAHLAGLAARVGGPARDRRLASLRAAGATTPDVRRVMRAEALTWSVPGVLLGVGAGWLLWWVCAHLVTVPVAEDPGDPEAAGRVWDVPLLPASSPQLRYVAIAMLLVVLLATLLAPVAVRRVAVGIGGQRVVERQVRPWVPAALLVAAAACPLAIWGLTQIPTTAARVDRALAGLTVVGPLLLLSALTTAAPLVARGLGRVLVRGGGATRLLAGRAMIAHPMLSARACASLVLVGLAGGLLAGGAGVMESEIRASAQGNGFDIAVGDALTSDGLYYLAPFWMAQGIALLAAVLGLVGVVVAVGEHAITRRSRISAMVAGGIPRAAVARAMVIEAGLPAAVMGPLALLAGLGIPFGWMALVGLTDRITAPWGYVTGLLALLALAPFAAAWVGSRLVARADDLRSLRDR